MDVLDAIVLGVIEGLTEFLPISSTGHLIIARPWLGLDGDSPQWHTFLFVVQLGAIMAVLLFFWRRIWRQVRAAGRVAWSNYLPVKLAVALVPSVVVGLALNDVVERHLEDSEIAVAGALIVGAGVMELIDRRFRTRTPMRITQVSVPQAFLIGIAQTVSIWPGVSRAMATIMGGMLVGLPATVAAEFSFYLAIPTMLLASGYRVMRHSAEMSSESAALILTGAATAFVVALIVVAGFMQYVQTRRFTPFAVYRVVLGVLVLILAS